MALAITLAAGELVVDDGPTFNLATCVLVDIAEYQPRTPYAPINNALDLSVATDPDAQVQAMSYSIRLKFNDLSQFVIPLGASTTIGGAATTNSLAGAEAAKALISAQFA